MSLSIALVTDLFLKGRFPQDGAAQFHSFLAMSLSDDPLTLECKYAAQQWLQSTDPLIQDFGARLLCLLTSKDVTFGRRGSHTPPCGLIPSEFEPYPWSPGTLRGNAEHVKLPKDAPELAKTPLREFWALENTESVGLRLGVFWASQHWRYLPHLYEPFELHHSLRGHGRYFKQKSHCQTKGLPLSDLWPFFRFSRPLPNKLPLA